MKIQSTQDFDGDQVTVKMVYSVEANKELENFQNSNGQFITLNGINGRHADKEAIQAMYNLTLVLPGTKLTDPVFQKKIFFGQYREYA